MLTPLEEKLLAALKCVALGRPRHGKPHPVASEAIAVAEAVQTLGLSSSGSASIGYVVEEIVEWRHPVANGVSYEGDPTADVVLCVRLHGGKGLELLHAALHQAGLPAPMVKERHTSFDGRLDLSDPGYKGF